ncbi:unnamed protein product [Soboliphyme baturini]|uniref:Transmembrane protein 39A n=1 Tax=Soboliphyme baturini TaxID=241478 RepID=A0A183IKJ5_9BILA|nr:unnamed protein product [Soboliphyme baturini]
MVQGELFFECTLFLYSVLVLFLQYLNLYKTMWWLPNSHTHYALKFHLIDLYVLSCVGLILGRRVILCFLNKLTVVPYDENKPIPLWLSVLEWIMKLPVITAIIASFSFSFVHVLAFYSRFVLQMFTSAFILFVRNCLDIGHALFHCLLTCNIFFFRFFFNVLIFYNEFVALFTQSSSLAQKLLACVRSTSYLKNLNGHTCSLSPSYIREEVDTLISDFYHRLKQSFFAAMTTAYYAVFIPCCFAPSVLYIDYWWMAEMSFIVFSTAWTAHLGQWTKIECVRVSHIFQVPYTSWSGCCLWPDGSVVKHYRSVYKGSGCSIAADPSNEDHRKFYVVRVVNGLCVLNALLILCPFLMLIHSYEWQHIMTLVLLMFTNYILLFKMFKDKIIMSRIYFPTDDVRLQFR